MKHCDRRVSGVSRLHVNSATILAFVGIIGLVYILAVVSRIEPYGVNPFLWPGSLFGLLSVFSLLQVMVERRQPELVVNSSSDRSDLLMRGRDNGPQVIGHKEVVATVPQYASRRRSCYLIALLLYLILLPRVGFAVLTPIFIFALIECFSRSFGKDLVIAVVATGLLILVFTSIFYLPLPAGQGVFRQANDWTIGLLLRK